MTEESHIQFETISDVVEKMIEAALLKATALNIDIYTFSVYHEHDSSWIVIYIDSEKNSDMQISSENRSKSREFMEAIRNRDLEKASWEQASFRNLVLPCFAAPKIVYAELSPGFVPDDNFYISIVEAIEAKKEKILSHSTQPEKVIFTCSTPEDMFGLIWSGHYVYQL